MNSSREAVQHGFTYVAVMVMIAILALTAAASLSAGTAMQQRLNEEELLFIGGQFAGAFRSYADATPVGQRPYPSKLDDLLRDPRYPGVRRHLRRIYVDPMTGTAEWGIVPVPGGIVGVHSLSQAAPLKIAEFEPSFAALTGKKRYADWKFGFLPAGIVPSPGLELAGIPGIEGKPELRSPPPGGSAPPPSVPPATIPSMLSR